ncbi:MAG: thioredoxin family protein [Desulfuromonas sp.]|nr:MAG: thioredoxin family protein [Desulfuromonas sp.]
MRIDILCRPDSNRRCDQALENVRTALDEMAVEAEVHLYRDSRKMIDNRVYVTPALLIDDDVRVAGRVPAISEIRELIKGRPHYRHRIDEVA